MNCLSSILLILVTISSALLLYCLLFYAHVHRQVYCRIISAISCTRIQPNKSRFWRLFLFIFHPQSSQRPIKTISQSILILENNLDMVFSFYGRWWLCRNLFGKRYCQSPYGLLWTWRSQLHFISSRINFNLLVATSSTVLEREVSPSPDWSFWSTSTSLLLCMHLLVVPPTLLCLILRLLVRVSPLIRVVWI